MLLGLAVCLGITGLGHDEGDAGAVLNRDVRVVASRDVGRRGRRQLGDRAAGARLGDQHETIRRAELVLTVNLGRRFGHLEGLEDHRAGAPAAEGEGHDPRAVRERGRVNVGNGHSLGGSLVVQIVKGLAPPSGGRRIQCGIGAR